MKSHTVGFGLYCDNICHGKDVKLETGYKLTPLPLRHLYGKKIDETTIHEVLNFVDIETLGMYGNSSPVIYEAKQYVRKKYPNAQSIAECLWLEEHGYSDVPRCVYCDELLVGKFISSLKGYFATCSTECSVNIRRQKYDASGKLEQKIKTAELDYSSTHVQCLDRIKKLHLFRHDICCTEYETVLTNSGQMSVCPKCKENNISRPHQAVLQFCKDNYDGEIEINNRKIIKPLELDIWIPKLKLAIEVDGVYWHQEESSPQQKKKLCLEKGINLLHISDFEWRNNRSAWENILLSKLKKQKRLFARKCSIKEISTPEARAFCEKHHFQRYASASVHLGLFYLDELVAYMSFGKPRFTKKYDYELIRFCSQSGLTVVGGASKLFKYFINQYSPNSIVSYANANYSNGNLYRAIGMTYSHFNDSSYVYIRGDEVLTRYACQKHKLSELLGEQYDSSKTERDNMLSAGYVQFFDRGTFVFTYQK
jgi:very-short-patch-repair endonuclease